MIKRIFYAIGLCCLMSGCNRNVELTITSPVTLYSRKSGVKVSLKANNPDYELLKKELMILRKKITFSPSIVNYAPNLKITYDKYNTINILNKNIVVVNIYDKKKKY